MLVPKRHGFLCPLSSHTIWGGDAGDKLREQCNLQEKHPTARSHGHRKNDSRPRLGGAQQHPRVSTPLNHRRVNAYSVVRGRALTCPLLLWEGPTTSLLWWQESVPEGEKVSHDILKCCYVAL